MDLEAAIEPVTTLKTRSAEMISRARESAQPIIITQNGKATAVLQDIKTFEQQRDALLLLAYLAQGDQQIRDGKGLPHADAVRRIRGKLSEMQKNG